MDHNRGSTTMTEPGPQAVVQRFHATNGKFSGYLGLVAAAIVLVLALRSWGGEHALVIAISALLGGTLVWVALLRPALWVTTDHLVMRSLFHTDHVPLGAITKVVVGQVLAVQAGGRRYASPVVAYTARQILRSKAGRDKRTATAADTYQVFVEERILHLAAEHREIHGDTDERARRSWAWPEIAAVVALAGALVVALLV